ncbi:MAG TPA: hypothetical protein VEW91_12345 [bacterium]|nr:hypothetical protein [bacterium]
MTPQPDMPSIIASPAVQRALRPRNDLREPGWTFWELRTLNMHRVVGLLNGPRQFADARDLEAEIRGVVSRNFKRSWWRGMAYGVVAEVATISLSPDDLKMLVDVRENEKGTLQWVILVASEARVTLGVHTWIEGYLSPVYRATLQALAETGYQVASAQREKDGLMKFLTAGADVNVALRSLGTKRVAFPEFRDPYIKENETR